MQPIDWLLVLGLNGAIIVYGLTRIRDTRSSTDWFLAGRSLPWWVVGLSLYATAIDSSDLVADSGGVYTLGIRYFVTNWVGTVLGWVVAANFIVLPMYRFGMFTNAEYLEARYGVSARVISALVQVQYRTMVLGIIATTIYLTLSIVCGWSPWLTWSIVLGIALLATIYTALGGLRSVAITDALQSIVMVVSSLILFVIVWQQVGGWTGIEERLAAHSPDLPRDMLHVGADLRESPTSPATPAWLVACSFLIAGLSYSIVNHTQSMRMLGARSEWDLRMSAVIGGVVMLAMTFTNLMVGVMGRALHPEVAELPLAEHLQKVDSIYPLLIREAEFVGVRGLIVAGVLAASLSTFDSIGSTLSSLLVRDVYARLLVVDRQDGHYLMVGRWLTPLIIFGSFAYVPFLLQEGMLLFYLDLVGAFVVPLLTIYLMGAFSPVHPKSGTVGLLVGVGYGALRLLAPTLSEMLGFSIMPPVMLNSAASYLFSLGVTAGVMVLVSLRYGWVPAGDLKIGRSAGWLRDSQQELLAMEDTPTATRFAPLALSIVVVAIGAVLSFVVFW